MSPSPLPKISFGIIVFNGQPFVKYCLRSLYPFAHQIIVVEGACKSASSMASATGHSTDGTVEELQLFKQEEDPDNKVQLVIRDGFWNEKDEQSQQYALLATGEYLWQVDIDEFYKPEDINAILTMLQNDPEIAGASFQQITFWGGFNYIADSWYLRSGAGTYHRLFRWGAGYRYITHRPPTVVDPDGRNLRESKWIKAKSLADRNIFLYHYSLIFPKQVQEKCEYHGHREPERYTQGPAWANEVFLQLKRPYRVHNVWTHPSWLERYQSTHPPQIEALRSDLKTGRVATEMRPTSDVEKLLTSLRYRTGRVFLKCAFPFFQFTQFVQPFWLRLVFAGKHPLKAAAGLKRRALRLVQNAP